MSQDSEFRIQNSGVRSHESGVSEGLGDVRDKEMSQESWEYFVRSGSRLSDF
jgi:hypothetical protein